MPSLTGWWKRWKSRADRTVPTARLVICVGAVAVGCFTLNAWLWTLPVIPVLLVIVVALVAVLDRAHLRRQGVPVVRRNLEPYPQLGRETNVIYSISPGSSEAARSVRIWTGLTVDSGVPASFRACRREVCRTEEPPHICEVIVPTRRGPVQWGDYDVCWTSRLGFWSRYHRFAGREQALVLPDVTTWRRDAELLQQTALLDGRHVKRYVSGDSDFAHITDYTPDDDPRRINWAATARRRRMMKNVMQPERGQTVWIAVDASRYMAVELPDGKSRLDHALECACALAKVAMDAGDNVGVVAFADTLLLRLPPSRGPAHWKQLVHAFAAMEARPVQGGYHALLEVLAGSSKRSLFVVFSELEGLSADATFAAALVRLRQRHPTLLVSVADMDALNALHRTPDTTRQFAAWAAAEWVLEQRTEQMASLRRTGVDVLESPPGEIVMDVIKEYLHRKRRFTL